MNGVETLLDPEQVVALLDVERERSARLRGELITARDQINRFHALLGAFKLLGEERGFTEQDARDRWKAAGYGGL